MFVRTKSSNAKEKKELPQVVKEKAVWVTIVIFFAIVFELLYPFVEYLFVYGLTPYNTPGSVMYFRVVPVLVAFIKLTTRIMYVLTLIAVLVTDFPQFHSSSTGNDTSSVNYEASTKNDRLQDEFHGSCTVKTLDADQRKTNASQRCEICKKTLSDDEIMNEKVSYCPVCEHPFHTGHLAEWVKSRGRCPVCRMKIQMA